MDTACHCTNELKPAHSESIMEFDNSTVNLPSTSYVNWTLFMINNVITILILTDNSLTVFIIISNKSLRTNTNCFAVSLAVSDLLMGGIYPLYNTLNYTHFADHLMEEHYACALCIYIIVTSAGASLLSLLAVSIDRYIAVLHPLRYKEVMTSSHIKIGIASLWIYMSLAALSVFYVYNNNTIIYFDATCSMLNVIPRWYFFGLILPHMIIPNIGSKILYGRMVYAAWKQQSKIYAQQLAGKTGISKKEAKATKMMSIILTIFALCWFPYLIMHICIYCIGEDTPAWLYVALEFSKILMLSNSFMNPVIYFWKNPDLRHALVILCGCSKKKVFEESNHLTSIA